MRIAMYKGPAPTLWYKFVRLTIRVFDTIRQTLRQRRPVLVRYSHCELVIDGFCYSSSERDGGVRRKAVDLNSGHWDVFDITGNEQKVLLWFQEHDGENYDWVGIVRFILPSLKPNPKHWFCSEACGEALGLPYQLYSPHDLLEIKVFAGK